MSDNDSSDVDEEYVKELIEKANSMLKKKENPIPKELKEEPPIKGMTKAKRNYSPEQLQKMRDNLAKARQKSAEIKLTKKQMLEGKKNETVNEYEELRKEVNSKKQQEDEKYSKYAKVAETQRIIKEKRQKAREEPVKEMIQETVKEPVKEIVLPQASKPIDIPKPAPVKYWRPQMNYLKKNGFIL
jgi:CO dehydrogenase/acetyl-CoA synthase alpha subunit